MSRPQLTAHGEDGPVVSPPAQSNFGHQPPESFGAIAVADDYLPCCLKGGCALWPLGFTCVVCLAFVSKR